MLKKTNILGVNITNENEDKILEFIFHSLRTSREKFFIVTPNPEIIMYAKKHKDYQNKLNEAKVSLPDGVGVYLAGTVLGKPLESRIPGVDFIEKLCENSKELPVSIGFLGGRAGVAQRTFQCLKAKYPWIEVVFVGEEWDDRLLFDRKRLGNNPKSAHDKGTIHPVSIDLLFVAYGFPKQEEWIYKNLKSLPIKAAMGVGGAFDYISSEVVRAPYLIRAMGFEWLFRLVVQPWRIKRQLALIEFIFLVLKEKFSSRILT